MTATLHASSVRKKYQNATHSAPLSKVDEDSINNYKDLEKN